MFLSPLDGRYKKRVEELLPIFSEFGLARYRTQVEVEWLVFLSEKNLAPLLSAQEIQALRDTYQNFGEADFAAIKAIEKTTNHDVKAVELFLQSKCETRFHPFIHFGCTSEDINSTSYALMLKDGHEVIAETLQAITDDLTAKAKRWKAVPMLSRTHGQTATPTTLGKEFLVFSRRLQSLLIWPEVQAIMFSAKFSGATGNWAAHLAAYPDQDWFALSEEFVADRLDLTWNPVTTQIEPHDEQALLLNEISRASTVLIDLCRDIWSYISLGYFGQKVIAGEVGSSTMPHKVNPIDFENCEGNMKLTRGIARTLSDELPVSRWQRDLTDSTIQRNFGLVFGHFQLGLKSLAKGLGKIELKENVLLADLQSSPEVLTEAVQTVMRKNGHTDAYDQLKKFARGQALSLEEVHKFVDQIDISPEDKERLKQLSAATYVGLSEKIVDEFV